MAIDKITSKKIIELLRISRHPNIKGEWATFTEVRNGTGWQQQDRYMDLFALSCWPSKGFRSVAYEVKVNRSDFMKELLDPTKRKFSEAVAMECWFATPTGLVTKDEVPEGWGLVTVSANGDIKTLKMPTQRTPEPWGMSFIASLLRKASEPESDVPMALWKVAGKDLTMDELKEVFSREMERIKAELTRDIRLEEQMSIQDAQKDWEAKLKAAQRLKLAVGYHLNLSYYDIHQVSMDQMTKKLEDYKANMLDQPTLNLITSAHAVLGEIIEETKKSTT